MTRRNVAGQSGRTTQLLMGQIEDGTYHEEPVHFFYIAEWVSDPYSSPSRASVSFSSAQLCQGFFNAAKWWLVDQVNTKVLEFLDMNLDPNPCIVSRIAEGLAVLDITDSYAKKITDQNRNPWLHWCVK